jgi:hypothetical protein
VSDFPSQLQISSQTNGEKNLFECDKYSLSLGLTVKIDKLSNAFGTAISYIKRIILNQIAKNITFGSTFLNKFRFENG